MPQLSDDPAGPKALAACGAAYEAARSAYQVAFHSVPPAPVDKLTALAKAGSDAQDAWTKVNLALGEELLAGPQIAGFLANLDAAATALTAETAHLKATSDNLAAFAKAIGVVVQIVGTVVAIAG